MRWYGNFTIPPLPYGKIAIPPIYHIVGNNTVWDLGLSLRHTSAAASARHGMKPIEIRAHNTTRATIVRSWMYSVQSSHFPLQWVPKTRTFHAFVIFQSWSDLHECQRWLHTNKHTHPKCESTRLKRHWRDDLIHRCQVLFFYQRIFELVVYLRVLPQGRSTIHESACHSSFIDVLCNSISKRRKREKRLWKKVMRKEGCKRLETNENAY